MRIRGESNLSTLALALLVSCGGEPGTDSAGSRVERTEVGDTTIVRTTGTGVWSDTAALVEQVSIGVLEGPEEYQFGIISDLAVDRGGGVYVFDGQVPALRYYDRSGAYVRTIGAEGRGPGEYLDAALGLGVRRSDGRLVMRDPRNTRLNVYNPDGSHSDSWRVESGLFTANATVFDAEDHMYLKILTARPEPNKPWPVALLHLDSEGEVVDTLVPPVLPNEPTDPGGFLTPQKIWAYSPLGGFVVGVSNSYRISHYRSDGTVIRMERDVIPIPVHPEERSEYQARSDWLLERQGQFSTDEPQPIPNVKPFYRDLLVGQEGSIWVRRYTEARKDASIEVPTEPDPNSPPVTTWREPNIYDVFDTEGTFLGSVAVPPRTNLRLVRGNEVWGIRRGEFDEPMVVRFQLDMGSNN